MTALLALAWRLARSGGGFRTAAIVGGTAVAATLLPLMMAVPQAIRSPNEALAEEDRLVPFALVGFLCLPVTVLVMCVSRLSATVRDRRLAALRLLGLSPGRTRMVCALENGILATAGATAGWALSWLAVSPLESVVAAGPGWFRQPLQLSWPAAGACAGIVAFAVLVSLAPTRALRRDVLKQRRDGVPVRPSRWRLVPLSAGVIVLAGSFTFPGPADADYTTTQLLGLLVLAAAFSTGVGLPIALPVAVRVSADLIARHGTGVTSRLAARRLQSEAAATVRVISGLTVAVFLVVCVVGALSAFQSNPQYQQERAAYEQGPQRHRIELTRYEGEPPAPPLTRPQLRAITTADGVLAVTTTYDCIADQTHCGPVFVGTCQQLALVQTVPGCVDDRISLISDRLLSYAPAAAQTVTLANRTGATATVTADSVLRLDENAPIRADLYRLFVPTGSPQLAPIATDPTGYIVLTARGEASREALAAAADGVPISLQYLGTYRDGQAYQLLVWTLASIVLGIGLLTVLLAAIDRAIERRRQVAAQIAHGVPVRIVRASQLLQTLTPLWLGLASSIGLGYLAVAAYLRITETLELDIEQTVLALTGAALTGGAVVAAATLPGIGARLTPDLLRRE